jgi:hypothetical protein
VSFFIDALNLIAAVAALPAIYALLARAAVVFSQRTNNRKTLNARQLFALADRNFVRYGLTETSGAESFFFFLGAALILLCKLPKADSLGMKSQAAHSNQLLFSHRSAPS